MGALHLWYGIETEKSSCLAGGNVISDFNNSLIGNFRCCLSLKYLYTFCNSNWAAGRVCSHMSIAYPTNIECFSLHTWIQIMTAFYVTHIKIWQNTTNLSRFAVVGFAVPGLLLLLLYANRFMCKLNIPAGGDAQLTQIKSFHLCFVYSLHEPAVLCKVDVGGGGGMWRSLVKWQAKVKDESSKGRNEGTTVNFT